MALTINSSSYNGKHAGAYISASLRTAESLEYATVRSAVNHKEVINVMSNTNIVKDASCGFDEQSSALALNETVLSVEQFQVNQDICRGTLMSDWAFEQSDDFVAFALSYVSGAIADSIEGSFWAGNTSTSGQFNGITTSHSGSMTTDTAGGTYTATNIVGEIRDLVTAIPSAVYMKDDLYIYMNKKTYRLYVNAVSALGGYPFNHMGQPIPEFEGTKIAVVGGLADNIMYAGRKSNLFFGTSTDLDMDFNEVRVLDMADLDGSQNIRLVARFTAGVAVGVASDFVYQS
jgi:hypothetical protein